MVSLRKTTVALLVSTVFWGGCAEDVKPERGALLVLSGDRLLRYQVATNQLAWDFRSPQDDGQVNRNQMAISGNHVYVPFESGLLASVDIATGKPQWQAQILPSEGGMTEGVADADGSLNKDFLQSLRPVLMAKPLVDGQQVYMPTVNRREGARGALHAFGRHDGSPLWERELQYPFGLYPPVVIGELLFINNAPLLYKLDRKTGSELWVSPDFGTPLYAPMQTDGVRLYVATEASEVFALEVLKDSFTASPAPQVAGQPESPAAPAAKFANYLWRFKLPDGESLHGQTLALEGDRLFMAAEAPNAGSTVYALEKRGGTPIWRARFEGQTVISTTVHRNGIYGHTNQSLFLLDKQSGEKILDIPLANQPLSNLVVTKSNLIMYVSLPGVVSCSAQPARCGLVSEKSLVFASGEDSPSQHSVHVEYLD